MTLAILDPCLFDPRQPVEVRALDELIFLMRRARLRIPQVDWYWDRIVRDLVAPLSRSGLGHEYQQRLDALRDLTRDVQLPELPPRVTVWGFSAMFGQLGGPWTRLMQRIVTGCVLAGEPTFLLTSLRDGINAARHPHGHVVSVEKACWNLRVRPKRHALARVLCLCCYRNFVVAWGAPKDEGAPGTIHHVPRKKRGRLTRS